MPLRKLVYQMLYKNICGFASVYDITKIVKVAKTSAIMV